MNRVMVAMLGAILSFNIAAEGELAIADALKPDINSAEWKPTPPWVIPNGFKLVIVPDEVETNTALSPTINDNRISEHDKVNLDDKIGKSNIVAEDALVDIR